MTLGVNHVVNVYTFCSPNSFGRTTHPPADGRMGVLELLGVLLQLNVNNLSAQMISLDVF